MATSFTNTPIDHTSDAGFRAWGSELSGQIGSVGTISTCLTQTADTGQINWASVARPGTNTAGGYEIWQLTDSLGVSSPVYLKVEYGTGSSSAIPMVWVTTGTGTNGSGTLTGSTSTRFVCGNNSALASTVLSYPNYVSCSDGHLGVFLKGGASSNKQAAFFAIERFCNPDGTLRTDGIQIYGWSVAGLSAEAINLTTALKYGGPNYKSYCMIPCEITTSASGSDIGAFKHYGAYPGVHSLNGVCTILASDMGFGTSDVGALNGATPRTYIMLGSDANPTNVTTAAVISEPGTGRRGLAMLWD